MKKIDDIDKLFKSTLEERKFDLSSGFIDSLNESIDMRENSKIDELFESSLAERSFDMNPLFLEDLNQRLDLRNDRKKRKGFHWWIIALGLLLIGVSAYLIFSPSHLSARRFDEYSFNKKTNLALSNIFTPSNKQNLNKTKVSHTNLASNERINNIYKFPTQLNYNRNKLASTKTIKSRKELIIKQIEENRIMDRISYTPPIYSSINPSNNEIKPPLTYQYSLMERKINQRPEQRYENQLMIITRKHLTNSMKGTQTKLNERKLNLSDSLLIFKKKVSNDTSILNRNVFNENNLTETFSAQFGVGGSYVWKTLIPNSNINLDKRATEEQALLSTSLNLSIKYNLSNWKVRSGFHYSSFGEKINYTNELIENVIFDTTIVTDIGGNIDTTYTPIDTVLITDTNSNLQSANGKNQYHYLTIPLSIGYTFKMKNTGFNFTPQLGIGFRFATTKQGNYISNTKNELIKMQEKRFQISYHTSLEMGYRWNTVGIFIESRFDSNIKNFNDIHHYRSLQIEFGLSYFF